MKRSDGESMVQKGDIRQEEVERKLKLEYLYGERDRTRRLLDDLHTLIAHMNDPKLHTKALLQEAADVIHKDLWIREVTIGLRSPSDSKYRYVVMSGLRPEAWRAHEVIEYTHEEFNDPSLFNGRWISECTKVFLAEDEPFLEGEEETFNRPILLKARRRTPDDCIEGDYLDVNITAENGNLVGWIEISGTREGKFPDAISIRWLELIASLLAIALQRDREGEPKRKVRAIDERSG
ncbi:MAG: GAF domain-containing protein [Thermoplasmata archaeon]|nr:GAF domain-containing protein [Thermoplasmata archaeon]